MSVIGTTIPGQGDTLPLPLHPHRDHAGVGGEGGQQAGSLPLLPQEACQVGSDHYPAA